MVFEPMPVFFILLKLKQLNPNVMDGGAPFQLNSNNGLSDRQNIAGPPGSEIIPGQSILTQRSSSCTNMRCGFVCGLWDLGDDRFLSADRHHAVGTSPFRR